MYKKTSLFLLVVLLVVGCATTPPYNPFSVEKDNVYNSVKTIGIMPFYSEVNAEGLKTKLSKMESIVKERLENAGFNVVESISYTEIYDEFKEAMGPLYDPNTGQLDKEKNKALREQTLREYLSENNVDALFHGGTVVVKAHWYQNNATWNGAKEATSGKEGFWASFALGQTSGTIPAVSFSSYLERADRERLYSLYGGIQLVQWYKGGKFVNVPSDLMLSDEARVNLGIQRSLEPLIEQINTGE